MSFRAVLSVLLVLLFSFCPLSYAADGDPDTAIIDALQVPFVTNGVAVTKGGRIFMTDTHLNGEDGPDVIEWKDGQALPYPDQAWNHRASKRQIKSHFIRVNALRIGPDGALWLVDTGSPALGKDKWPHGARLIQIDLRLNRVRRIYDLESATHKKSMIDDVRFNAHWAYVTDAGDPGIIVLNLTTGKAARVLDHAASTTAAHPISAEHILIHDRKGHPVLIHADQLEVSPDGQWLYYQPACGPLSRIETKWLNPALREADRLKHVSAFAETGSTGGTAIDNAGNLYVSDTDNQRVLIISPDAMVKTLIADPRLLWVDAMWITADGYLWMPAAQLNRLSVFEKGPVPLDKPIHIFKAKIDIGPAKNDHS